MPYRDETEAKIERLQQELTELRGQERGLTLFFKWVMIVGYLFSALGIFAMVVALIFHTWKWTDAVYTCFAFAYVAEHTRGVIRAARAIRQRRLAARGY